MTLRDQLVTSVGETLMSAHSLRSTAEALGAVLSGRPMPPDTCPHCDGAGRVKSTDWWSLDAHACPDCDGTGEMAQEPDPSPEERAVVESRLAAWDERHSAGIDDIDYPEEV